MEIRSLISPIGNFNVVYVNSLLVRLVFLNKNDSTFPLDKSLQKFIDGFFSLNEFQEFPKFKLRGSSFQLKVWNGLLSIPRGQTETYGSLAQMIGVPKAFRAVGTACKMNPIPLLIPCHRVVKQNGSIGEFTLGSKNKEYLLKMESK